MKLNRMTESEIERYREYCIQAGNTAALAELADFQEFYENKINVVKGRKIPHGTKGTVFYVERVHYGYQWWKGWSTRIGFKDDLGNTYFNDSKNVVIVSE
jgi:hypothetical protein